ncbi:MAG: hypothetical protein AAFP93_02005 [Bacteroidota bacterium]
MKEHPKTSAQVAQGLCLLLMIHSCTSIQIFPLSMEAPSEGDKKKALAIVNSSGVGNKQAISAQASSSSSKSVTVPGSHQIVQERFNNEKLEQLSSALDKGRKDNVLQFKSLSDSAEVIENQIEMVREDIKTGIQSLSRKIPTKDDIKESLREVLRKERISLEDNRRAKKPRTQPPDAIDNISEAISNALKRLTLNPRLAEEEVEKMVSDLVSRATTEADKKRFLATIMQAAGKQLQSLQAGQKPLSDTVQSNHKMFLARVGALEARVSKLEATASDHEKILQQVKQQLQEVSGEIASIRRTTTEALAQPSASRFLQALVKQINDDVKEGEKQYEQAQGYLSRGEEYANKRNYIASIDAYKDVIAACSQAKHYFQQAQQQASRLKGYPALKERIENSLKSIELIVSSAQDNLKALQALFQQLLQRTQQSRGAMFILEPAPKPHEKKAP